jgi:sulfotransferase famil protein
MSFPEVVFDFKEGKYKACDKKTGILFHHIPKTAGSTFRAILENLFVENEVCPAEIPEELESLTNKELDKFKLFAGHFSYEITEGLLLENIWVTFLRNPIDRVVSYYYNLIVPERMPDTWVKRFSERADWQEFLEEIRKMSLYEFILSENEKATKITANRQTQAFLPDNVRLGVKDWSVHNVEYIELAKHNLRERFAFVGIQEYFDLSLDLFSMTFSLNPIHAEPYTTNLNIKKNREEGYEVEPYALALIKEKNTMDIELYEYAKELFFERMHIINRKVVVNNHMHLMNNIHNKLANKKTKTLKQGIDDVFLSHGFYPLSRRISIFFKYGFYPLARSMNLLHRWNRESPAVIEFLFNFKRDKTYLLSIEIARCLECSIINTVSLELDQKSLTHQVKKKWFKGSYRIEARVDGNRFLQSNTMHRLEILSDFKLEHEQPGVRQLSIAVSKIGIVEQ